LLKGVLVFIEIQHKKKRKGVVLISVGTRQRFFSVKTGIILICAVVTINRTFNSITHVCE
jgi:hypothetical protein